jgi:hypothetical protein
MALELSGDIAGLGKIVQIVRATDTTQRSTTSNSYVDANISVTITPQKSDSKVLVLWFGMLVHGGTADYAYVQITDASNNAISGAENAYIGSGSTSSFYAFTSIIAYATPATTSATTYKLRFKALSSGTAQINNNENTGQMYAIEVAA